MPGSRPPLRVVAANVNSLATRLRDRRLHDNLTQRELGRRFGVRQQTVGAWELGERPQSRFHGALVSYLGLDDVAELKLLLDGTLGEARQASQSLPAWARLDRDSLVDPSAPNPVALLAASFAIRSARGDLTDRELGLYERFMQHLAAQGDGHRA